MAGAGAAERGRGGRAAAAAALAVLLASGCVEIRRIARPPQQTARAEVEALLSARARSLLRKDPEGYLRPLSPSARAVEEPIARGAGSVPLSEVELLLDRSAEALEDGARYVDVRVDLSYRYEGLPEDNVFRITFGYDLERREAGWMVTGSRPRADSKLPAWATGAVEAASSPHVLALFRPGTPRVAEALDVAERARGELAPKVTLPLEPAYLVLLAANRTEYDALAAGPAPVSVIAQTETFFEFTPGAVRVLGRHMVVNLEQLFSKRSPAEILQHELAHLALAPWTRPFTSGWLTESAAMYLAGSRPVDAWRRGTREGRFASMSFAELGRVLSLGQHDPSGEATSYQYAYAAAAAWYLVEAFGPEPYWQLYRASADVPPEQVIRELARDGAGATIEAGPNSPVMGDLAGRTAHDALLRIYGFDESELDRRVRDWIRRAA